MARKQIIEVIIPPIKVMLSTKKIEKKISSIWNTTDSRNFYSYRYSRARISDLEKLYDNSFTIKDKLEDKGKSTIFVISLVITLFTGFVSLLYNERFYFYNCVLKYAAFIDIGISFVYLVLSVVLSLFMIGEKNIVYNLDAAYYNIKNDAEKKDQLGASIESNDLMNLIRNNYVSAAFQSMINAIALIMVFVLLIFINRQY